MKFEKSTLINEKMHNLIPGGGHTYSKGDDQFPENAPKIMDHAKGAWTWDIDDNKYLDWAMGNRVMILGHANDYVDNKVIEALRKGTNYTRPGILEYELAEYLVGLWPSAEMVKFGKNGSDVTTAAIKLSRAYTSRKYVLVCEDHPFFSSNDWFIGSTAMNSGTIESERELTLKFKYNDRASVEKVFDEYKDQIAAVIMEPVKNDSPYVNSDEKDLTLAGINRNNGDESFLQYMRDKTTSTGTVLIFDEMISGMRFDIKGAHHLYGVYPDLVTFGKAISNGYACSVLAGKKDLMELGGIKHDRERVFLLSQTHGSETVGLAATLSTLQFCEKHNVSAHVWKMGAALKKGINDLIGKFDLQSRIKIIGFDANPQIISVDRDGAFWAELNALLHSLLLDEGILIPWISITYAHQDEELQYTIKKMDNALSKLKKILDEDPELSSIDIRVAKPVFRKWN